MHYKKKKKKKKKRIHSEFYYFGCLDIRSLQMHTNIV
jgi:hypothetical protein